MNHYRKFSGDCIDLTLKRKQTFREIHWKVEYLSSLRRHGYRMFVPIKIPASHFCLFCHEDYVARDNGIFVVHNSVSNNSNNYGMSSGSATWRDNAKF